MSPETEPADRAGLLLQRIIPELLLDCRAVAEQLGAPPPWGKKQP